MISRRRRERTVDRRLDWRNPDLPILTRVLEEKPWGIVKIPVDMSPEEMQITAKDSMEWSETPEWDSDPSYNWARPGARKRRI